MKSIGIPGVLGGGITGMVSRKDAVKARIKQAREACGLTMKQMTKAIGGAEGRRQAASRVALENHRLKIQEAAHGSSSSRAARMSWRTQADPPRSMTCSRTSGDRRSVKRGAPWPS